MDWITLSDQERLCRYADEICGLDDHPALAFPARGGANTYFVDAKERHGGHIPDLMRYEPASIRGVQEKLRSLWKETSLPEPEMLIKICCAATLKNEPYPLDYDRRLSEWKLTVEEHGGPTIPGQTIERRSDDTTSSRDDTEDPFASVLVYEF